MSAVFSKNTEYARRVLLEGKYTLVLYNGMDCVTSYDRGVKPLLDLIKSGRNYSSFSAADRVVGRAAAFLYLLLGIKDVYATVLSEPAYEVFCANDMSIIADTRVEAIMNRSNTGFCPMETAVRDVSDPNLALSLIIRKLSELQQSSKQENRGDILD